MFDEHPLLSAIEDFTQGLREVFPLVSVDMLSGVVDGKVTVHITAHPAAPPHAYGFLHLSFGYSSVDDERIRSARAADELFPDDVALECSVTYHAPKLAHPREAALACERAVLHLLPPEVKSMASVDLTHHQPLISAHPRPAYYGLCVHLQTAISLRDVAVRDWRQRGVSYRHFLDELCLCCTGSRPANPAA